VNTTDQKAIERVRRVQCGESIRAVYGRLTHEWDTDCTLLALLFVGETSPDEGEPVTAEWLRQVGFEEAPNSTYLWLRFGSHAVATRVWDKSWVLGHFYDCGDYEEIPIPPLKTRGDVRRLCKALFIPLKEV
jgi:hypothetical protein